MERWDFDCQVCEESIGDYAYVDEEWYCCPQKIGLTRNISFDIDSLLNGVPYRKHTIRGRGWKRLGYTLCKRCAIKAKLRCPICGAKLLKIHADQHPGGLWGIKGEFTIMRTELVVFYTIPYTDKRIPKREPAPMW